MEDDSASKQSTKCFLLDLPAELRMNIYELVASSPPIVYLQVRHRLWRCKTSAVNGIVFLMTCKQIHEEAHDVVWKYLRFDLEVDTRKEDIYSGNDSYYDLGPVEQSTVLRKMEDIRILIEPNHSAMTMKFQGDLRAALERVLMSNHRIIALRFYVNSEHACIGHPFRFRQQQDTGLQLRNITRAQYGGLIRVTNAKGISIILTIVGGREGPSEMEL